MGQTNGTGEQIVSTDDDETLDKRIKENVMRVRQVLNDDERRLYVDRVRNEPGYTQADANADWGVSVRQYLREIKRLWSDTGDIQIRNVKKYWEQMQLAPEEELYPPDYNGFQFSLVRERDQFHDDRALRDAIGLGPRGEIPEPKLVSFEGLMSVLERNRIEKTWAITTHRQGPPPEHNTEVVRRSLPLPKHVLENAVEAADNFLQQAGLGFDVKMPDYYGGDEAGL